MSPLTFTEFVETTAKTFNIPDVACGVWEDGEEIFCCHGVTSVENPLPIDQNTLFALGSITKTFTATTLMHPRLPRLKEWAYAGMFFNMTGAFISHAIMSDPTYHFLATGSIAMLVVISWALRPYSRTLGKWSPESLPSQIILASGELPNRGMGIGHIRFAVPRLAKHPDLPILIQAIPQGGDQLVIDIERQPILACHHRQRIDLVQALVKHGGLTSCQSVPLAVIVEHGQGVRALRVDGQDIGVIALFIGAEDHSPIGRVVALLHTHVDGKGEVGEIGVQSGTGLVQRGGWIDIVIGVTRERTMGSILFPSIVLPPMIRQGIIEHHLPTKGVG